MASKKIRKLRTLLSQLRVLAGPRPPVTVAEQKTTRGQRGLMYAAREIPPSWQVKPGGVADAMRWDDLDGAAK